MYYLRQFGYSKSTNLVLILIGIVVCFFLYHALSSYYKYFEIRNQMHALAKIANVNTDVELRDKLLHKINQLEIPANEDDIQIERSLDGKITIMFPYKEEVKIKIKDEDVSIFSFNFFPKVQETIE